MTNISANFGFHEYSSSRPLRLQLWEVSGHVWSQVGATYQFRRLAEVNVRDEHDFDMLGDNLGHDHGRRQFAEHALFYMAWGCGSHGGVGARFAEPGFARLSPRAVWLTVYFGLQVALGRRRGNIPT